MGSALKAIKAMSNFLRKALRNFLIITALVIIAAIILTRSKSTRDYVTPPGMRFPDNLPGERSE
ncbi:MAG: hypothetical protein DCC75_10180 [Proteobacteria bacterium]|nr:MAG: hypothetical protein DCC75_10180 [Pseudomonadota bacterium]